MDLASYRKSLGLSQEECARALGISSKGYVSGIERGARVASLRLAMRIERWSGGAVDAATLNPEAERSAKRQSGAASKGRAA